MSQLTREEVEHISKLAKLNLTDQEVDKFSRELTEILDFVDQLNSLKTENISPLNNVTGRKNVFREDEIKPSLSQKDALANATSVYHGYFKVKAIFSR